MPDPEKMTHREELEAIVGPVNEDTWQLLKVYVDTNYDAGAWLQGVLGYKNARTGEIWHPSEVEIIRRA